VTTGDQWAALPTVSVVIPSYNRAQELPGVIETVLSQSCPAHEVILVDDGSRDDTPRVARSLLPAIRYIRQENQGVSVARNRGIREATGELVALLDTDDRWQPRKLEVQATILALRKDIGWSATEIEQVREGAEALGIGGLERGVPVFREVGHAPADWFASTLEEERFGFSGLEVQVFLGDAFGLLLNGNFIFPSTVVARRDLLIGAGLFDPSFRRAEETDFFLRLAADSPVAMVMHPLTSYRTGGSDALSASAHVVELTELALRAVRNGIGRRAPVTEFERRSAARGQRNVLLRQAYAHLSDRAPRKARRSLGRLRKLGLPLGVRGRALGILALMPAPVLGGLGRVKALARRWVP
jgi:GT2 family glycosyltransferase